MRRHGNGIADEVKGNDGGKIFIKIVNTSLEEPFREFDFFFISDRHLERIMASFISYGIMNHVLQSTIFFL